VSDDRIDASKLSEALIIWIHHGRVAWHQPDQRSLAEQIGSDAAGELLPRVRELRDEFYASDAYLRAPDLVTMAQLAASDFRPNHPEISETAIRALALSYTYDNK
jgi:hypothetical protein